MIESFRKYLFCMKETNWYCYSPAVYFYLFVLVQDGVSSMKDRGKPQASTLKPQMRN
jgi:hypothetical protein